MPPWRPIPIGLSRFSALLYRSIPMSTVFPHIKSGRGREIRVLGQSQLFLWTPLFRSLLLIPPLDFPLEAPFCIGQDPFYPKSPPSLPFSIVPLFKSRVFRLELYSVLPSFPRSMDLSSTSPTLRKLPFIEQFSI